jgi:hypothetical protein
VLLKVRATVAFMVLMVLPLLVLVYLLWWLDVNSIDEKMPNYLMRLVIYFFGASTNFHLQVPVKLSTTLIIWILDCDIMLF